MKENHMLYTIKSDSMTYTISPLGAEVQSAKDTQGFEYIWQGGEVWDGHAPVLFPLCGRLKDNLYTYGDKQYSMNCHGIFPTSTPEAVSIQDSKITFRLSDSEATLTQYPFPFSLTLTYEAKGRVLSVSALIENKGKTAMPFMYGGHPAINVPLDEGLSFEDYKIDLGRDEIFINPLTPGIPYVNPKAESFPLPYGQYTLSERDIAEKDTLVLSGIPHIARLYSPKGRRSVVLRFDDAFKYICLWKMPTPDAKYICIEPWSGIPQDGIVDEVLETRPSMIWLEAGESTLLSYSLEFLA